MVPSLRPGDLVRLRPVFDRLAAGDLVAMRLGDRIICHRVTRCYPDEDGRQWVVTKGDRSAAEDFPSSAALIVGRVTEVIRPPVWNRLMWRTRGFLCALLARRRKASERQRSPS